MGDSVVFSACFAEFGEEEECEEEGGDDVHGQGAFVVFEDFEFVGCDAGVFNEDVEAGKLGGSFGEGFDGVIAGEVEGPDFDDAVLAAGAFFDGFFGCVSFSDMTDRKDDFSGIEAGEVAGRFETESDIGAGDDDGLAGEGAVGVGKAGDELVIDEFEQEAGAYAGHGAWIGVIWYTVDTVLVVRFERGC